MPDHRPPSEGEPTEREFLEGLRYEDKFPSRESRLREEIEKLIVTSVGATAFDVKQALRQVLADTAPEPEQK